MKRLLFQVKHVFYFLSIWCLLFSNPLFSSKATPASKPTSDVKVAAEPVKGLDAPLAEDYVTIIVKSYKKADPENPLKLEEDKEIERKDFPRIYLQHSELLKAAAEGEPKKREYDLNKQYMQISLDDLFAIFKALTHQAQEKSKLIQEREKEEKVIRDTYDTKIAALKESENPADKKQISEHERESIEALEKSKKKLEDLEKAIDASTQSVIQSISDKNSKALADTFAYLGIRMGAELENIIMEFEHNMLNASYAKKAKKLKSLDKKFLDQIRLRIRGKLPYGVYWDLKSWFLKLFLPTRPIYTFDVNVVKPPKLVTGGFELPSQSTVVSYLSPNGREIEIIDILTRKKTIFSLTSEMIAGIGNQFYRGFMQNVSNDGSKVLVSIGRASPLEVWDVIKKTKLFSDDFNWIEATWSSDNSLLAVHDGKTVHIYDVNARKFLRAFDYPDSIGKAFLFAPDNSKILINCEVFSVQDGKRLFVLTKHCKDFFLSAVSWALNGDLAFVEHVGGVLYLNILNDKGEAITVKSLDESGNSFWSPDSSIVGVLGSAIKLFYFQIVGGKQEIGQIRPPIPVEGTWALWQKNNVLISGHYKDNGVIFYYWNMKRFIDVRKQLDQIKAETDTVLAFGSIDQLWLLNKIYHLSDKPLTFTPDEQEILNTFPPTLKSLLMSLGKEDKELQEKQKIEVRPVQPTLGARDTKHTLERVSGPTSAQDPRAATATPAPAPHTPSAAMRASAAPAPRPAPKSTPAARPSLAAPKMIIAQAKAQWSDTHKSIADDLKNPSAIKASVLKNWAAKIRAAQKTHSGFSLAATNKEGKTLEQLLNEAGRKHNFSSKFPVEWKTLMQLFAE